VPKIVWMSGKNPHGNFARMPFFAEARRRNDQTLQER
jgi:hypothetical protein